MSFPLQITSRDFELTDAMEQLIHKKAQKLETFYHRIQNCDVVIELPHKSQKKGKEYLVGIQLKVPGSEIVVKRKPHADIYAGIRDAFTAAQRLVEDFARKQRRQVSSNEDNPKAKARVKELFPVEGYGFLETDEGTELYFHKNSVVNDSFNRLDIGSKVRYVSAMGDKGPQASTVDMLG